MSAKSFMERIREKGVVWLPPDATVQEAALLMADENIRSIVVLDKESGQLRGIFTVTDGSRMLQDDNPNSSTPLSKVMTKEVVTVRMRTTDDECSNLMEKNNITHLVLVDDGHPVGVISMKDLYLGIREGPIMQRARMEGYLGNAS